MKKIITALSMSFIFTGCVIPKIQVTRTNSRFYQSLPENAEILTITQIPNNKNFEEIAIISCSIYGHTGSTLNALLPTLKEKARALGANAILIKSVTESDDAKLLAVAIRIS